MKSTVLRGDGFEPQEVSFNPEDDYIMRLSLPGDMRWNELPKIIQKYMLKDDWYKIAICLRISSFPCFTCSWKRRKVVSRYKFTTGLSTQWVCPVCGDEIWYTHANLIGM